MEDSRVRLEGMSRSKYSQWYATRQWRAIRAEQLQREPLCRFCMEAGRLTPANTVDHVTPHRGDRIAFWTGALQSLCATCHSSTKQRMEAGKGAGCDAEGWPIA